jgi:glycolate oxidase iron-sulfur subunit
MTAGLSPMSPLQLVREGLDSCVHCGFCLQACPTYIALGDENDSPRGRLVLMRALVEGTLPATDPDVDTHISRCLGCRACETACPSGVPYGELLEATRATLAEARPISLRTRAILWLFATPGWLAVALWLARVLRATRLAALAAWLPAPVGVPAAMLASTTRPRWLNWRRYASPGAGARGSVALLSGCVMEGLFAETNRATGRVLLANDYTVRAAPGQRCCGALHVHAGDPEGARQLARVNIDAFLRSGATYIGVNAAGCGAMLKEYDKLLADDPAYAGRAAELAARVRDITELLADAGPLAGGPLEAPHRTAIAYDPPCHLLHAQRVESPPFAVLGAIPDVRIVPLADSDQCCGGAGIYNLLHPRISEAVLGAKLARIAESGATVVATGNPGCMLQIGAGLSRRGLHARTVHPIDLLDASYAARA